ncbi:ExeM/NucH family extracellular endonuclease [Ilumatobacter nonamiensis]|uniref:ExeM/NucH family extracellular endonuclease n=1 Tax=Ilumatobacter nonamiensis TaxID=467093 RepID=UPI0011D264E6|nr:ExeM/NucH family extracellular endonuclease [Ilumatobacter nonamiensis]
MTTRRHRTRLALLSCVTVLAGLLTAVTPAAAVPGGASTVFINEIHYDNIGTDTGEFVEVAGPAGTDLTGWSLQQYNGNGGGTTGTPIALSGTLADSVDGYGFAVEFVPGLQNGSPDGIALLDGGTVVQFLSYEGSFAATNGPAAGEMSTDIGVSQPSSTPVGESLQLVGTGSTAVDFAWTGPAPESPGAANAGQTFGPGGPGGTDGRPFPFIEGFDNDDCAATGWEVVSVDTDQANTWTCSAQFSNADVNGFGDDAAADEWLITPALNMDAQDDETLNFRNYTNFTAANYPQLEVLVSTDYDGAGDPTTATWAALSGINYSPEGSGQYVDSGPIDLSAITGTNAYFAFHYTSGESAASWRIDSVEFTVEEPPDPTATPALISEIQGSGPAVTSTDRFEVQGIVTSLFEDDDALDGFFIQEEDVDSDGDAATSEAIFVFCRGNCPTGLAIGDLVTVVGAAEEYFGMSQIGIGFGSGTATIDSSGHALSSPVAISLPAAGATNAEETFENVEGMRITVPDKLVVSEYFNLARYGEVVLTVNERPDQFTDANAPSVAGYAAFLDDLAARRIVLDDDNNDQNDRTEGPQDNEPYPYPQPGLSTTNYFRGGDSVTDLVGVMHWSFAGQPGTDAWRIRPSAEAIDFDSDNQRTTAPEDVGGSLQVASFNVLNYFTTLDVPGTSCGPNDLDCRGANSQAELDLQRAKIVSALATMDSDIVGLIEIENDEGAAVADLVGALNAVLGADTYDYVDTGTIGGDAIKVALIFKPSTVSVVGDFAILDSSVDPAFIDDKNRPALIQTFEDAATGARFNVAVNHLKSKGSDCNDLGDPDLNDGQANCNQTRTDAANALADYLATDPTNSGSDDALIIGDLNAYAMEDPITALTDAGYTDLLAQQIGEDAYTYVFDGQLGYLDHALANASMIDKVTGATAWSINADEISLLDYNDDIRDPNEQAFQRESSALPIDDTGAYRSSDHDPVIVGLDLVDPDTLCNGQVATILGTDGRDHLLGTRGDDVIVALGGNDRILGLGGNDVICGADGRDVIITGSGDDTVFGGAGNDLIVTGSGDDAIDGGAGIDILLAGRGTDTCTAGEIEVGCEA